MATITATLAPAMGNSQRGRNPYMVEQVVDLTANSINPNGDVVQCITVPANTKILAAGFQVTKSATQNTGTDATAILGTGADDNEYVTAFDIDGASASAYAAVDDATARVPLIVTADGSLKLTFAGTAGTISAGIIRVFAVCMPIEGSLSRPTDVDRDQLA